MPADLIDGLTGITSLNRASKRGISANRSDRSVHSDLGNDMKPHHLSKKLKQGSSYSGEFDVICEKENLNREKSLVPRARAVRILAELMTEASTDCSDFEFSDDEQDPVYVPGMVYHEREARVADVSNRHYHFDVFED